MGNIIVSEFGYQNSIILIIKKKEKKNSIIEVVLLKQAQKGTSHISCSYLESDVHVIRGWAPIVQVLFTKSNGS